MFRATRPETGRIERKDGTGRRAPADSSCTPVDHDTCPALREAFVIEVGSKSPIALSRWINRRRPVAGSRTREGERGVPPPCGTTAVMNLTHRRLALLSAGLVLMGTFGGCQSTRYRTACATAQQTGYGPSTAPASPEPNPVEPTPYLRGESMPVPPLVPEGQLNRPVLPPAPPERPQVRGFQGGPALGADADEDLDEEDEESDIGNDVDEPIFPKGGSRPPRLTLPPSASVNAPGRATLSSSSRAVAGPGHAPRYQLPVTRRLPSSTAAAEPRVTSDHSDSGEWSTSVPIPLANPPALLTPPTERR
jgi:hypothetical protein